GETKDWINAAIFLKDEIGCQFVLHMAHSALLRLQYNDLNNGSFGDCSILELACCTDYSMLYHTSLCGNCYNELIILSGNCCGEIIIWQPHDSVDLNTTTCTKTYPLCLRLKAHNGVIFSIDLNLAARLLVTTSDDRSLKFWQLESESIRDWKYDAGSVRPLFSCFGHTARVICATIAEYDGQVYVISGGEDSHICVWSQSGEMLFKRRQQFGSPIWRLSFDHITTTLYCTGSTGNVLAYNLKSILNARQSQSTQLIPFDSETEFMKNIKYLNSSAIIALSSRNRLFLMKQQQSKSHNIGNWELVPDFPKYKCTLLAVCDGMIATCGYKRSFHFLSKDLYLMSDEYGNCILLKGQNMDVEGHMKISNCREPWITMALLVSPTCLLLSIRNGNIMLYSREAHSQLQLKNTIKRLHGPMGSNVLQLLKTDEKYAYILSAGHEPVIKYLRLCFTNYDLTVDQRECVPLSWIEALPKSDVLIGFNDNHLVAWSRKNDVLFQLQCGGGHRCWDYQLNNEQLDIIYVKQKHVFHHRAILDNNRSGYSLQAFQNCWHMRSCNIMQLLKRTNDDDDQTYIVSAGDDNIIKISQFTNQSFNQCTELHTHISSVRHLTSYPIKLENGVSHWLLFSVGGRSQLCINQLDPSGPVVRELCTHTIRTNIDGKKSLVDARLMSISILRHAETGDFHLYVASADGKIIMLRWQLENPSQVYLIRFIDIKRCPLQLKILMNTNLLLITTTNGMLYGFDQTLSLKRLELKLHSAGINALETLDDGFILHVLTSGDDEIIKHTTLNMSNMTVQRSTEFPGLHNAQINALILHSTKGVGRAVELYAYTCSIDKQIYMVNLTTLQYTRIGYTCISDIKGLLLDKNRYLYIYGCGLQVITLENK
ncbi:GH17239, partial [Drosophila grimshawi]